MATSSNVDPIVFYDGVCALCNWTVKFILRNDKEATFHFASLQSEVARVYLDPHGVDPSDLHSIVLLDGGKMYRRSAAILRILRRLGSPWSVFAALEVLPAAFVDVFYNLIARHRYRVFGKFNACPVPPFNMRERFLDRAFPDAVSNEP